MNKSFQDTIEINSEKIVQSIINSGKIHVITFKIKINERCNNISVYFKAKNDTHKIIHSSDFSGVYIHLSKSHFNFFNTFKTPIENFIIKPLFPCDLSDYSLIQMVNEDWTPVGDFA